MPADAILCSGFPSGDYCDCSGDCEDHAETFCGCEEAQSLACCGADDVGDDILPDCTCGSYEAASVNGDVMCEFASSRGVNCARESGFAFGCPSHAVRCSLVVDPDFTGPWIIEPEYVCVGEISSMDARCSALDNQEDCESEGVSPFSDGVCDWVMEEPEIETTCTPVVCGCSPGFNTVETTDGNGCVTECSCEAQTCVANLIATNMKCNSDTKFRNAVRGMDSAQMCVDENAEVGTVYNYMSVREGGCVLETTCEESDRVATNLDWQIYEVVCS